MPKRPERKISDSHPDENINPMPASMGAAICPHFKQTICRSGKPGRPCSICHVQVNMGDGSFSPNDPEAHLKTGLWIQTIAKRKHSMTGGTSWMYGNQYYY